MKGHTNAEAFMGFLALGAAGDDADLDKWRKDQRCDHHHHTVAAPEIAPADAFGAFTLLATGLAAIRACCDAARRGGRLKNLLR
jgi:hypothetical protein